MQEVHSSTVREAREQKATERLLGRVDYGAIMRYRDEMNWGLGPSAERMPHLVRDLVETLVHNVDLGPEGKKSVVSGGFTVTITESTVKIAFDEEHEAPLVWTESIAR